MQRQPISDIVDGLVTRLPDGALLSDAPLGAGETLAQGEITVRYGIALLGKPHRCLVPDLVVADRGEILTGEAAWHFIMERGHLFPRADVLGYGGDGADEELFLKELDLALPFAVFAYRDAADTLPLARLDALITAEADSFPKRLLEHLPRYPQLSAWRADA